MCFEMGHCQCCTCDEHKNWVKNSYMKSYDKKRNENNEIQPKNIPPLTK